MTDSTSPQGADHWKRKYYDQLDRLDRKEEEWAKLEAVLRHAIGRLSLAAEGCSSGVDRYIHDIRTVIQDDINGPKPDAILDELSNPPGRMEEKQLATDTRVVAPLQVLLESLPLPAGCEKAGKNLLKQFKHASDGDAEDLVEQMVGLLKQAMEATGSMADSRPGLFGRLRGTTAKKTGHTREEPAAPDMLAQLVNNLPWPAAFTVDVRTVADLIVHAHDEREITDAIGRLQGLIDRWKNLPQSEPCMAPHVSIETAVEVPVKSESAVSELEVYRDCLLSFLDQLDDPGSPNGRLAAFRAIARGAKEKGQLDDLEVDLAAMLSVPLHHASVAMESAAQVSGTRPSIQEMLIRLLEQLMVPSDLTEDMDRMKVRLETESEPDDWTGLLRDLATLINSIRSRMQQEKHEFEDFLHQITGRLNEMDAFLRTESHSIQDAEQKSRNFDVQMTSQVSGIRHDMTRATDLADLKNFLQARMDTISEYIRAYRSEEGNRLQDARHNVAQMQSKMASLEYEAQNLKEIIEEKNKQALFDALTGVPNRLAYDRKVAEEIARWKRFDHPLSLAVWDVDYFKKVNDSFGHKAGDKVLRTIAQLLNERIRETDFIARYGGEEFVMLLPGTREEETLRLVDELREKVATCGFHYHGDPVNVTVSCGVSSFQKNDTLEDVFERADQALYRAKDKGRNQCVVAACLSD